MSKNQYTMVFPLGAENSSMRSTSYEYESPEGTCGFPGISNCAIDFLGMRICYRSRAIDCIELPAPKGIVLVYFKQIKQ